MNNYNSMQQSTTHLSMSDLSPLLPQYHRSLLSNLQRGVVDYISTSAVESKLNQAVMQVSITATSNLPQFSYQSDIPSTLNNLPSFHNLGSTVFDRCTEDGKRSGETITTDFENGGLSQQLGVYCDVANDQDRCFFASNNYNSSSNSNINNNNSIVNIANSDNPEMLGGFLPQLSFKSGVDFHGEIDDLNFKMDSMVMEEQKRPGLADDDQAAFRVNTCGFIGSELELKSPSLFSPEIKPRSLLFNFPKLHHMTSLSGISQQLLQTQQQPQLLQQLQPQPQPQHLQLQQPLPQQQPQPQQQQPIYLPQFIRPQISDNTSPIDVVAVAGTSSTSSSSHSLVNSNSSNNTQSYKQNIEEAFKSIMSQKFQEKEQKKQQNRINEARSDYNFQQSQCSDQSASDHFSAEMIEVPPQDVQKLVLIEQQPKLGSEIVMDEKKKNQLIERIQQESFEPRRKSRSMQVTRNRRISVSVVPPAGSCKEGSSEAIEEDLVTATSEAGPGRALEEFARKVDFCKCKKSKCLKLYCECFLRGSFCSQLCVCTECGNKAGNDEERQRAVEEAKNRNVDAFNLKFQVSQLSGVSHKKGCKCKKTRCLKNYCECYNAGLKCSTSCNCSECENLIDNLKNPHLIDSQEPLAVQQIVKSAVAISRKLVTNAANTGQTQNGQNRKRTMSDVIENYNPQAEKHSSDNIIEPTIKKKSAFSLKMDVIHQENEIQQNLAGQAISDGSFKQQSSSLSSFPRNALQQPQSSVLTNYTSFDQQHFVYTGSLPKGQQKKQH